MNEIEHLEQVLLGKLINNANHYYENHTLLNESLFNKYEHKELYKVIDAQYQKNNKVDLTEFYLSFGDKSSAISLAQQCIDKSYDLYQPQSLVLMLNQSNRKKSLKGLCLETLKRIENEDDLFEMVNDMERKIQKIGNVDDSEIVSIAEQMPSMMKGLEKNMQSDGLTGIPSGFLCIDNFTSGWQKQDLVIIGGASSMGKTSFALNLALNAVKLGHPTVIFSYEMSVNQMLMRMVSGDTDINNKHLLKGKIYDNELIKIHSSVSRLEKLEMYIDECKNTSLKYLLNRIRQYVIAKNVQMVVVDYMQLISYNLHGRSREQEVSHVARALKNIAKELDITVIALSQLSRNVSRRETGRPTLADLRESGEIEQAADVVTFVYRPEYYGIKTDDIGKSVEGMAEIIFAKGRNIGIGSRYLRFIDYLTKFEEISTFKS
jgi:replicative DNA helicase